MNEKLKTIASLIEKEDIVLDIGTDHAYLPIYLKENKLCKKVYASDIHERALKQANKNIEAHHLKIETFLSDGFLNIPITDLNTVVIAGMGTSTILNIVSHSPSNIKKWIISSNNHLETLRKELFKKGLYIQKEIALLDNNKWYVIHLIKKEKKKETNLSLKYGNSNNKDYFLDLINIENSILSKIPKNHILKRRNHKKITKELKKLIKRNED